MSNRGQVRASVRAKLARAAALVRMANQRHNRRKLRERYFPGEWRSEFERAVARMTGRQRHAWARAGYPGLRKKEVERLWAFVPPERTR